MSESWRQARFLWGRMVRGEAKLTPAAKLLAWALCEQFADGDTGVCHPSVATMAEATGYKERHIKAAVKALEQAGYLTVIRAIGRANRSTYQLRIPAEKGAVVCTFKPREKVHSSAGKGAPQCTSYREPSRDPKARTRSKPSQADRMAVGEEAKPLIVKSWKDWLRSHGRDDEIIDWLTRDGEIKLPGRSIPERGSDPERWHLNWFDEQESMRQADRMAEGRCAS